MEKKIYFIRNTAEHGMFQDTTTKEELPDIEEWQFVEKFYPNYYSCNEIMKHDDLACYFDNEKTRKQIDDYNEDIEGMDENQLKQYYSQLTDYIFAEAAKHFYEMVLSHTITIIYE